MPVPSNTYVCGSSKLNAYSCLPEGIVLKPSSELSSSKTQEKKRNKNPVIKPSHTQQVARSDNQGHKFWSLRDLSSNSHFIASHRFSGENKRPGTPAASSVKWARAGRRPAGRTRPGRRCPLSHPLSWRRRSLFVLRG